MAAEDKCIQIKNDEESGECRQRTTESKGK